MYRPRFRILIFNKTIFSVLRAINVVSNKQTQRNGFSKLLCNHFSNGVIISRAFMLSWNVRLVLKNPFQFLLLCMRAHIMFTFPFFGNINCQSQIKILLTVSSFVPLGVLCSRIPLPEGRFTHIKPLPFIFSCYFPPKNIFK